MQLSSFPTDVAALFRFLTEEYAFAAAEKTSSLVQYESPTTFVAIYHDSRSGEVGIRIGLTRMDPKRESGYSIQEIMEALHVPPHGRMPDLYATNRNTLLVCLRHLAVLVRAYGRPVLLGDPVLYLALSDRRIQETKTYTNRRETEPWARDEIAVAWMQRDYPRVARLYAWLDAESLTRQERKQRAIARMRAVQGDAADADPASILDD